MSALPAGWTRTTIGEIASYIQRGKSPKYAENSDLPVINQRCIRWNKLETQHLKYIHPDQKPSWDAARYVRAGDLLWNSTGTGTVGRAYLIKDTDCLEPIVVDSHVTIVRAGESVDPRIVFRWVMSPTVQNKIVQMCDGSTNQVELSRTAIADTQFPLPPKAEQRRIADKLDTVLARVDAVNERLARVAPLLKRFRQSVLAAATLGRLTEEWRSAVKQDADDANTVVSAIQSYKDEWCRANDGHNEAIRVKRRVALFRGPTTLGAVPEGWRALPLEDAVLMVVDCHNKTAPYSAQGVPLIRTSNVRDGEFEWRDLRFVSEDVFEKWSRRCIPESGDLVFTREAPMGEVAIIPRGHRICLGQRTMLIRPIPQMIDAAFLRIAIMSPHFRSRASQVAVGTGVKHLRVGDVSELVIPVPCRAEQTEIVRRVEALFAYADRLEARLQGTQTATERLTPALLAKAFRGELVPQDPNDEPASKLLRRLAEQGAQASAAGKRGRKSMA